MLKTKEKSSLKSSPVRKTQTETGKVQNKNIVTKETAKQNDLTNKIQVNEIAGNAVNTAKQTNPTPTNNADTQTVGGLETKKATNMTDTRDSHSNGDGKGSAPDDQILTESCAQEGNDTLSKVTVEELSSILLDLASSLGKAPPDVKKMVLGDINPPETLKKFISAITHLTENTNCLTEFGNMGVETLFSSSPIGKNDQEVLLSKHVYDDGENYDVASKYVRANISDSSCYTDHSNFPAISQEVGKNYRKKNSDTINRIAHMYYEAEYASVKDHRSKPKRKVLVTDRSEYILLKPNEIRNKIKLVMKKYINSFEKFMEDEIQKQSSGEIKVAQKDKTKLSALSISACFLVLFAVSLACAVGYGFYFKDTNFISSFF